MANDKKESTKGCPGANRPAQPFNSSDELELLYSPDTEGISCEWDELYNLLRLAHDNTGVALELVKKLYNSINFTYSANPRSFSLDRELHTSGSDSLGDFIETLACEISEAIQLEYELDFEKRDFAIIYWALKDNPAQALDISYDLLVEYHNHLLDRMKIHEPLSDDDRTNLSKALNLLEYLDTEDFTNRETSGPDETDAYAKQWFDETNIPVSGHGVDLSRFGCWKAVFAHGGNVPEGHQLINPYSIQAQAYERLFDFIKGREDLSAKKLTHVYALEDIVACKVTDASKLDRISKHGRELLAEALNLETEDLDRIVPAINEELACCSDSGNGLRDFMTYELGLILDTLPEGPRDEGKAKYLERIARFNPEVYRPLYKLDNLDEFSVEICVDHDELMQAASNSCGCIEDNEDLVENYLRDEGTIMLVLYQNSRDGWKTPLGYSRLFICVRQDGERTYPVLAADTFEVGKHNEECGETYPYKDNIRMMGLAATQLMIDGGFEELHGKDSRVCYGLRQAFSNKQDRPSLMKLGYMRTYKDSGLYENDASIFCYGFEFDGDSFAPPTKTTVIFR